MSQGVKCEQCGMMIYDNIFDYDSDRELIFCYASDCQLEYNQANPDNPSYSMKQHNKIAELQDEVERLRELETLIRDFMEYAKVPTARRIRALLKEGEDEKA